MRLLGMPWGSSPMRPEAWAPVGLKYRSSTAFQACGAGQTVGLGHTQ